MINEDSLRAVAGAGWGAQFVRPLYDSYCFSQLPGLVQALLPGGQDDGRSTRLLGPLAGPYDKVVLLFVDAFGWRFFERYHDRYPFLQRFLTAGYVTQLTAQFPSTTAAHVTCIHTGLPVGQSGVYEWFYYEPLVDAMIAPLLYSFAGDRERGTLATTGVPPAALFPRTTLYQALAAKGVPAYVLQSQTYTPSPYSNIVFAGATVRPFAALPEALHLLADLLPVPGPGYYYLYCDTIDTAGHRSGPGSAAWEAAVDTLFTALEELFHRRVAGRLQRTLLLLTADHGQVPADPATTIYLNQVLPEIGRWMATNRQGALLVPAGSARDLFLHIQPAYLAEAEAVLRGLLAGRAEVHRVADLIAGGFFGPGPPADVFLGRVGNLVVLPYAGETVYWYEAGRFVQEFYGHHGGLARDEMETLLLALPYG